MPKKLDTRTTLRDKEIDEREECLKDRAYRKKNPEYEKTQYKLIKKRLELYNELFEVKLKVNPSKKAEKLSKIIKSNDLKKSYEQHTPLDYDAEVIPYTNHGMITTLLKEVLVGFQMKSKLNKTGQLITRDTYLYPKDIIKILNKFMMYLMKNLPGDDAYIIIDNYMRIYTDVIMSTVGEKL